MSVVYVKDPHQTSREKLDIPGDFKGETVRSLKTLIAGKIGLDQECFSKLLALKGEGLRSVLMYAGRVLKQGKTLGEYNIVDGVTIFYIRKKKEERRVREIQAEALSKIKQMLQNPRVFSVLQRLVKNPSLIASMLKESSILNTPGVQMLIHNVDLRECATDPETLIKAFKNCPEVIVSVADILNLLGTAVEQVTESTGYDHDLVEGELGVMFDRIADGADYFSGAHVDRDQDSMNLANAQTRMFQYSQALQAHRTRNTTTTGNQAEPMETTTTVATPQPPPIQQSLEPPEPPQVTNVSRQESTGSTGGITPDMLADALSYVQPQESPPPRPPQFDPAGLQARIPMRIPQPPVTASGPRIRARLPVGTCLSPLELMQALQSIGQTTRNARQQSSSQSTGGQPSSLSSDEQPSSLPSEGQPSSLPSGEQPSSLPSAGQPSSLPTGGQPSSLPSGGQPSSLPSGIQQQSSSSSSQRPSQSQQRTRPSDRQRHKYRKQLEQLKGMGIADDGAILHTLEATKGDINAALELLIGSGDIVMK